MPICLKFQQTAFCARTERSQTASLVHWYIGIVKSQTIDLEVGRGFLQIFFQIIVRRYLADIFIKKLPCLGGSGAVLRVNEGGHAAGHSMDYTHDPTQEFILSCWNLHTYEVTQNVYVVNVKYT